MNATTNQTYTITSILGVFNYSNLEAALFDARRIAWNLDCFVNVWAGNDSFAFVTPMTTSLCGPWAA